MPRTQVFIPITADRGSGVSCVHSTSTSPCSRDSTVRAGQFWIGEDTLANHAIAEHAQMKELFYSTFSMCVLG